MKNSYRSATLIYKCREAKDEQDCNAVFRIAHDMGISTTNDKDDGLFCQVVFGKDQIHNKVKFDTLIVFGAKSGQEVYHILKHKSLMTSVNKILVIYDDPSKPLDHRHWKSEFGVKDFENYPCSLYWRKNLY